VRGRGRPDGTQVVSGSADRTLKVWHADSGRGVAHPPGPRRPSSRAVSYSPDGKRLVSASHDKTLKVWDAEKDGEPLTLEGHDQGAWGGWRGSRDGKRIASGSADKDGADLGRRDGQIDPHAEGARARGFAGRGVVARRRADRQRPVTTRP